MRESVGVRRVALCAGRLGSGNWIGLGCVFGLLSSFVGSGRSKTGPAGGWNRAANARREDGGSDTVFGTEIVE
jgi:hypothetical protein